jgi:ubiquinone/menaquinone biosynthesis C-methylase UbiE
MKNIWNNFWSTRKITYTPISIFKNLYFTKIKADYVKKFISGSSILEVGCGDGKLLSLLPKNVNITGLDISSFALKKTKKNLANKKVSLILGDVFSLKFDNDSFDLILNDGLIEHYTDRIDKLIKEMYRVTKKGGFLITILTNRDFIRKILFKYIYRWDKEKIKTTKEYKNIFNNTLSKISKEYKIETIPKSFGIFMSIVVKKC